MLGSCRSRRTRGCTGTAARARRGAGSACCRCSLCAHAGRRPTAQALPQWHGHQSPYLLRRQAELDRSPWSSRARRRRCTVPESAEMISSTTAVGRGRLGRRGAGRRHRPCSRPTSHAMSTPRLVDRPDRRGMPSRCATSTSRTRVGGVRRADHEHQVGLGGDRPHRVPAGWPSRSRCRRGRARERGKPLAQRVDDLVRPRRPPASSASGSATLPRIARPSARDVFRRPRPALIASGASPSVPSTSSWPGVADQRRSCRPSAGEPPGLGVHLGHQRAGRVDHREPAPRPPRRGPPATRRARRTPQWRRRAPRRARPRTPRRGSPASATTCVLCTICLRT